MKNIPLFRWKRRYLHFIDILVVKDASYRRSRVSRYWPILAQWCEILFLLELLLELRPVNFHKSLPHTRFGLEARVGIDRVSSSTSHSKSIVYGIADCLTINELRQLSTHVRPYLFVPVFALLKGSVL